MKKYIKSSIEARIPAILEAYKNAKDIDEDTWIRSDARVTFFSGFDAKVDTTFLVYEPRYNSYPRFKGFAHTPKGHYDWDYLTADDIVNFDLDDYMDDIDIIDLEGMLAANPRIIDYLV